MNQMNITGTLRDAFNWKLGDSQALFGDDRANFM